MYARHVTVHGSPEKIDAGITSVRDSVLPVLKECRGFKGQLLLVDRDKGEAIGISLWESEQDMLDSEAKVSATRQQTADNVDATSAPEVQMYELPIYETQ